MKTLLLLVFLLTSAISFAQDNIIKKDGSELQAKVIEVTEEFIKYKRFDNLKGPLYSIHKKDVFIIQYENGTKDVFNAESAITPKKTPKEQAKKEKKPKKAPKPIVKKEKKAPKILGPALRNYLFFNGSINIGLSHNQAIENFYRNTNNHNYGFIIGTGLEFGGVLYLARQKMPKNFGFGLNLTLLNSNVGLTAGLFTPVVIPYSASLGPQFSFRVAKSLLLDTYLKPGLCIMPVGTNFQPAFLSELGVNLRINDFSIGLSGIFIPTVLSLESANFFNGYNNIYTEYIATYNYSHIRIKIGFTIRQKQ